MRRKTISYAISIALSLAFIGPVLAQTTDVNQEGAEGALEEVIVTGSRIRRDSFNVSTPLINMENDQIRDTGLGSMSEILIDEVPQIFESSSNTNSQSSVSQTGLSTINLRQLGSNRTLTLIDGVTFAEAEEKALQRQFEQAEQRFEVGLTAVTDVHEARASYDNARARAIVARNDLADAKEALKELTGQYFEENDALQ